MHERSLLEAALVGYKIQLEQINAKMSEIRRRLGSKENQAIPISGVFQELPSEFHQKRSRISEAARKRISAAQKKRWRAFHAQKKVAA